jgi:hypothetical protein
MATEADRELLDKFEAKKEALLREMVEHRILYKEAEITNDYPMFLYLASILNFCEIQNGGCLSEVGMMSLKVNISSTLDKIINSAEKKTIDQEELTRTSLNLLNSYATCILTKGMFELAREDSEAFFRTNEFPLVFRDDFETLEFRVEKLIPQLKLTLDILTPLMNEEHQKVFTLQKNNGFFKQIFGPHHIKSSGLSGVQNARECK